MSDNILPCLKVRDWEGRADTVCRVLWPDKPSQYMPWLAFGRDHPHTFEFLNAEKLKTLGKTEAQIEAEAIGNLRKRPCEWKPVDAPLDDKVSLKMLFCVEDFFAAERILDAAFLKDAQRRLGAAALLVGIPRRGVIMATPLTEDQQLGGAFGVLVAKQFERGESAVITPMCFVVKDGAVIGFTESVAEAMAARKAAPADDGEEEAAGDEAEADEEAPYVSAMIVKNAAGKLEVHIMGGGTDGIRLGRAFEDAFHQMVKKYKDDPEFGNLIKITVFGYTPVAAQEMMPTLLDHLRGIVADMQGHGMPPIDVQLEIQKDDPFRSTEPASPAPQPAQGAKPAARPAAPRPRPSKAAPVPPMPAPASKGAGGWVKLAGQLLVGGLILLGLIRKLMAP